MKYLLILFFCSVNINFAYSEEIKSGSVPKIKSKKELNNAHKNHQSHKEHKHEGASVESKKVSKNKVLIKVNGMVCAFCAQGVTKNFKKRKEVKDVKVDLDKMEVLVTYRKGQSLNEKIIEKIVTSAGFKYIGQKNAK